jgi:hypothetical protein
MHDEKRECYEHEVFAIGAKGTRTKRAHYLVRERAKFQGLHKYLNGALC